MTWTPRNPLKEFGWNEARVAVLRKLWTDGISATEIAKVLGGVTRNAVIGKIHRLGIQRGVEAHRLATKIANQVKARPKKDPKPKTPRVIGVVPDERPIREIVVPSLELTVETFTRSSCRYPTSADDAPEMTFCGQPQAAGRPYCSHHVALTTNIRPPLKPRSKPKSDFAAVAQTRRFG